MDSNLFSFAMLFTMAVLQMGSMYSAIVLDWPSLWDSSPLIVGGVSLLTYLPMSAEAFLTSLFNFPLEKAIVNTLAWGTHWALMSLALLVATEAAMRNGLLEVQPPRSLPPLDDRVDLPFGFDLKPDPDRVVRDNDDAHGSRAPDPDGTKTDP